MIQMQGKLCTFEKFVQIAPNRAASRPRFSQFVKNIQNAPPGREGAYAHSPAGTAYRSRSYSRCFLTQRRRSRKKVAKVAATAAAPTPRTVQSCRVNSSSSRPPVRAKVRRIYGISSTTDTSAPRARRLHCFFRTRTARASSSRSMSTFGATKVRSRMKEPIWWLLRRSLKL